MRDTHVVVNSEFVTCQICGKHLEKIDGRHTKKLHGITFEEYRKRYPTTPTITEKKSEKEEVNIEKRRKGKQEKENQLKPIICCNPNCPRKGEPFMGNINLPNKFSVCPECKQSGFKNPKNKEIYEKQKQGMLKKHKVKNPSNLNWVVNERQKTVNRKVKENPDYYKSIVKKRVNTIKEKFGSNWKEVLNQKSQEGMLKIHDVAYPLKKDEFNDNRKLTNKKRRGFEEVFQDPEIIEEIKQTHLRKSNNKYSNAMEFPENIKQASESLKESWKDPEVRERRNKAHLKSFIPRLVRYLQDFKLELLEEYQHAHYNHLFRCEKCKYEFRQSWNAVSQGYTCPNCRPKNDTRSSVGERQVAKFIESLGFEIVRGNRSFIKPFELDILIHSKKLAVEYDGLFSHCIEEIRDTRKKINDPKMYHIYKLEGCRKKDYRLINIFEDEWLFKEDIVKSRLKQILGKSDAERIHARDCSIEEVTFECKKDFLKQFHIQGNDNSKIYLGAFYGNILVSIMTFSSGSIVKGAKKEENVWELNRFCSDYHYHSPGIASKMLEHFKRNFSWKEIFSYADLRWSTGDLYYKLGFSLVEREIRPNYWYTDTNRLKRIHRWQLRKRPDEPKGTPEMVLRVKEGYKIIWDCGNLKFVLKQS